MYRDTYPLAITEFNYIYLRASPRYPTSEVYHYMRKRWSKDGCVLEDLVGLQHRIYLV